MLLLSRVYLQSSFEAKVFLIQTMKDLNGYKWKDDEKESYFEILINNFIIYFDENL